MGKEIKIFVGAFDIKKQIPLLCFRVLQGWIWSYTSTSGKIVNALDNISGKVLRINGAHAGGCVTDVARKALLKGASRVIIPLKQVMDGDEGKENPLLDRAILIAKFLFQVGFLNDKRLEIIPAEIWNEAKKIVQEGNN